MPLKPFGSRVESKRSRRLKGVRGDHDGKVEPNSCPFTLVTFVSLSSNYQKSTKKERDCTTESVLVS